MPAASPSAIPQAGSTRGEGVQQLHLCLPASQGRTSSTRGSGCMTTASRFIRCMISLLMMYLPGKGEGGMSVMVV